MRESTIERYLTQRVKQEGGVAYKFTSPSARGVADRIVCLPGGQTWFVELKAPGGRMSLLQKIFADEMSRMEQNYVCLWSKQEVDEWIREQLREF
jgi:hypothetical protein